MTEVVDYGHQSLPGPSKVLFPSFAVRDLEPTHSRRGTLKRYFHLVNQYVMRSLHASLSPDIWIECDVVVFMPGTSHYEERPVMDHLTGVSVKPVACSFCSIGSHEGMAMQPAMDVLPSRVRLAPKWPVHCQRPIP